MMRIILLVIASASALWSLAAWLVGGVRFSFGAVSISSTDPLRPLAVAVVFLVVYCLVSGTKQVLQDLKYLPRLAAPAALVLAIFAMVIGVAKNNWTAGGSDSYAYVTQADLLLQGTQTVLVPIADAVPWPDALWTFTPHGYRPAASGTAIVPVTAPGLSLMMAIAKKTAGHPAMFYVVPATGALLVWATFLIGRRMASPGVGLAAAWLMAASPAFLAMIVSPMSDVPAAAFWALALYFALDDSPRAALLAGSSVSIAILIRPNLAPLGGILFLALFVRGVRNRHAIRNCLLFSAAAAIGCIAIAYANNALHGSPLSSGYGNLSYLFSSSYVSTNIRRYGTWFLQSQTPVAALGAAALLLESWMLAVFVVGVFALYAAYTPFEAWWYLRFLLPAWPAICAGTAVLLLKRLPIPRNFRFAAVAVVIGIGLYGINFAATHAAFPSGEGDHRYATIGKLVEQATNPASVIITGQNSGATRYYGGRLTMRFDLLDRVWLDRAVAWLADHQRHPYFLLEEWELPLFQQRFTADNKLGALTLTPILAYQAPGVPGQVYLFDPLRPDGPTLRAIPPASARPKCVEPAESLMLNLQ